MSQIVDFYRGQGTDSKGRSLTEIRSWDNDDLEAVHDFIQWLFPLPEPSQFNPDAPLLSAEDITAFKSDPVLRANLMKSFHRILGFLGFALGNDGKIVEGDSFSARIPDVWAMLNHNWLRITRILRSLMLLGMDAQAQALYERLSALFTSRKFPIPPDTFRYWTDAMNSVRNWK
jgi:hypothetical protein